ncbi:hypothetical protein BC830DRAFT_223194 [Chytriomyces sp. MP71]|nr:hypothetical protein BC830DRAFT_223194 [Chytriomyces sp. MP71]
MFERKMSKIAKVEGDGPNTSGQAYGAHGVYGETATCEYGDGACAGVGVGVVSSSEEADEVAEAGTEQCVSNEALLRIAETRMRRMHAHALQVQQQWSASEEGGSGGPSTQRHTQQDHNSAAYLSENDAELSFSSTDMQNGISNASAAHHSESNASVGFLPFAQQANSYHHAQLYSHQYDLEQLPQPGSYCPRPPPPQAEHPPRPQSYSRGRKKQRIYSPNSRDPLCTPLLQQLPDSRHHQAPSSARLSKLAKLAPLSANGTPLLASSSPALAPTPATVCPATIPTITLRENDVEWIEFTYEIKGKSEKFEIRTDVDDALDLDALDEEFKVTNCIYPGARVEKANYKGNRYNYEKSVNEIGWKLCFINASICGKKGLIQRAVDSFRNRFEELRSRRVVRHAKFQNGTLRRRPNSNTDKILDMNATPLRTPNLSHLTPKSHDVSPDLITRSSEMSKVTTTTPLYHERQADQPQQQRSPNLQQTPLIPARSTNAPLTPFDSVSRSIASLPQPPTADSRISRHLTSKSPNPKSLCVETVVGGIGGNISKSRIRVDIESVDAILATAAAAVAAATVLDNAPRNAMRPLAASADMAAASVLEVKEDTIRRFASSAAFRRGNCVFPRALDGLDAFVERVSTCGLALLYAGGMEGGTEGLVARYEFECFMNEVAWRLAVLNRRGLASEEYGGNGCREILQRALDTYRGKFLDGTLEEW